MDLKSVLMVTPLKESVVSDNGFDRESQQHTDTLPWIVKTNEKYINININKMHSVKSFNLS